MRSLIVAGFFLASLPIAVLNPSYGLLAYLIFGYLNPHRLAWGSVSKWPVAYYLAVATIIGFFARYKGDRRLPSVPPVVLTLLFWLLASLGWLHAINPDGFFIEWSRLSKILLMVGFAIALTKTKDYFRWLIFVVSFSIGFYCLKGVIWGLLGGVGHVFGPPGSFIEGNNGLGMALNMVWPLFLAIGRTEKRKNISLAAWLLFASCPLCVVLTNSRASAIAMGCVAIAIFFQEKRKTLLFAFFILVVVVSLPFIPASWTDRLATVQTYQQDASAMGRINAWHAAWNLALDKPLVGGGLRAFTPEMFVKYAPEPENFHDAHSIYFETLGELGFPGLFLFASIFVATFISLIRINRFAELSNDADFYRNFSNALRAGLVGYLVNGLFVGMAYFDLAYQFVGFAVSLEFLMKIELSSIFAEEKVAN